MIGLHPYLKEALLDFYDRRGWSSYEFFELFYVLSSLPEGNKMGENNVVEDLALVLKTLPKYKEITFHDVEDVTMAIYDLIKNKDFEKFDFADGKVIRGYLSEIFSFEKENLKEGYVPRDLLFYLKNIDLLGSAVLEINKLEFASKEIVEKDGEVNILLNRIYEGEEYGKKVFEVLTYLKEKEDKYVEKGYSIYEEASRDKLKNIMELLPFKVYRSFIDLLFYLKKELPSHMLNDFRNVDVFVYLTNLERYLAYLPDKETKHKFIKSLSYVLKDETSAEPLGARFLFTYFLLDNNYEYLIKTSRNDRETANLSNRVANFVSSWYDYAKYNGLKVDEVLSEASRLIKQLDRLALPHEKPQSYRLSKIIYSLKNVLNL